jgi:hypothetical protein
VIEYLRDVLECSGDLQILVFAHHQVRSHHDCSDTGSRQRVTGDDNDESKRL